MIRIGLWLGIPRAHLRITATDFPATHLAHLRTTVQRRRDPAQKTVAFGLDTTPIGQPFANFPYLTRNAFMTSLLRWLMALKATRPDFGRGNGRDVVLCRMDHGPLRSRRGWR